MPDRLRAAAKRLLAFGLPDCGLCRLAYGLVYRSSVVGFEASQWLWKVIWVEPALRSMATSVGGRLRIERLPYVRGQGQFRIGSDVYISGKLSIQFCRLPGSVPTLTIGDHSFVGHDCCFHVARGIRVGTHCLLAGGSRFYDTDGHPLDARRRRHERISPDQAQEIRLGDDVWVGAGCTVLKGVTIGNRAIVGAGSVVTRDVPADTIVAGNPARVLRSLASAEPAAAAGADTRDS